MDFNNKYETLDDFISSRLNDEEVGIWFYDNGLEKFIWEANLLFRRKYFLNLRQNNRKLHMQSIDDKILVKIKKAKRGIVMVGRFFFRLFVFKTVWFFLVNLLIFNYLIWINGFYFVSLYLIINNLCQYLKTTRFLLNKFWSLFPKRF